MSAEASPAPTAAETPTPKAPSDPSPAAQPQPIPQDQSPAASSHSAPSPAASSHSAPSPAASSPASPSPTETQPAPAAPPPEDPETAALHAKLMEDDGHSAGWREPRTAPTSGMRLGVATGASYGQSLQETSSGTALIAGGGYLVQGDIGYQISGRTAAFLRAQVASLVIINQASAYAMVEYHFTKLFFLQTGLGVDVLATFGNLAERNCTSCVLSWAGLSVPAAIGLTWPEKVENILNFRTYVHGALGGAYGVDPSSGTTAWHLSFVIGAALVPKN